MALSRTLIRTYAVEHGARPELALSAANRRILADARADLFVTVFYGILDPTTGTFTYCNAGHNPPYLLGAQTGDPVRALAPTGPALGILEEWTWQRCAVQLPPGSALVLYTDGITEAHDPHGVFFEKERLLEILQAHRGGSAPDMQKALLTAVHEFAGDAAHAQSDDITLVVLVHDSTTHDPQNPVMDRPVDYYGGK